MMLDHDLLKAQERHTELLRESNNWRLAKLASARRPRHTLLHSRLLHRFGRWLVTWGWQLQVRYGNLETVEF
jgi:hypothetical protein